MKRSDKLTLLLFFNWIVNGAETSFTGVSGLTVVSKSSRIDKPSILLLQEHFGACNTLKFTCDSSTRIK